MFFELNEARKKENSTAVVCGLNIEQLYPVIPDPKRSLLKSPLNILTEGKKRLSALVGAVQDTTLATKVTTSNNSQNTLVLSGHRMLQIVNEIRQVDLAICTSLLGGFMEQQEINIPLVKSRDHSQALHLSARASVGMTKALVTLAPR